jgi:hypothetical protein
MNADQARARGLATDRYRSYLAQARRLGIKGSIPAARMAIDSAMRALDDIAALTDDQDGDDGE